LIGDHDVLTTSVSSGDGRSTRKQRILPAGARHALQRGQAILLATGSKAALVNLAPWYHGPDRR